MKDILLSLSCLCSLFSAQAVALDVWVSPQGDDAASGLSSAPVATLQQAVDLLAQHYKAQPFEAATIWLKSGIYTQRDVVKIDASLFGGSSVKLSIASADAEKAQISGGYALPMDSFAPIKDEETLSRLHPDAASQILVVDLKGTGLESAFAQNTLSGTGWDYRASNYSFVSCGAHMLQLAQWPNRAYAHIDEVLDAGPTTRWLKPGEKAAEYSHGHPNGAVFNMREKKNLTAWSAEFARSEDVLVQGYLDNDWYYEQEKVGAVKDSNVELLRYTRYGVVAKPTMIPRRVRFVNLLCELDEPGEWYYDNESKRFFLYPIEGGDASTPVTVLGSAKFLQLQGLDGFSLKNVVFENGGAVAVELHGCSNSLLAGCVFRNLTGRAFNIGGGTNNAVVSCDFYGLQSVGSLSGGDRVSLTPCGHSMLNNHIYDCRQRGYGLIGLSGVGIRFAHNVVHDTNGALSFNGNDIIMEFNEFYNMGWEMGDWNVAYIGADWASFGNELRYNFVHHLMEMPGAYPVEGFRNDDGGMGVQFHGNIFYKSGRGCVAFSGAGNGCYNNIALQTGTIYQTHLAEMDEKALKERWSAQKRYDDGQLKRGDKDDMLWRAERFYGKMGWNFEPYRSKYPVLKMIMDDANPFAPSFSVVENNYIERKDVERAFYVHRGSTDCFPKTMRWEFPESISMDAFTNPDVLDFSLKADFKPMEGFVVTDFAKIGLYDDEYRKAPDKAAYRSAVKAQFAEMRSNGGKYDTENAYKRYPVPSYLK